MEDKTFELLTKMYSEFSEFRKDITKEVQNVGNQVTRLEAELKGDVKVLFDGYKQTDLASLKQTVRIPNFY